jgi:hypothetical protein
MREKKKILPHLPVTNTDKSAKVSFSFRVMAKHCRCPHIVPEKMAFIANLPMCTWEKDVLKWKKVRKALLV